MQARNTLRRHFIGIGITALAPFLVTPLAQAQGTQTQSRPKEVPKEVRIGWQKGLAITVLARKHQVIETRLKSLGVESVKWVEFQFGPPMLEALGAGAIDLGSVGDTPPIFAQASGSPLLYVAATSAAEHAVLVPKDSPVQTLAQLKGKKVAIAKGSSAQNVVIKALATAGLNLKDIEPIYLAPADATAAFNGGKVDAWVVWDPYFAIAEQRYKARAIAHTADKRLASSSYYMAQRDFAQGHPAVLKAVLDEFARLTVKAGHNRAELAAVAAEATGIDEKIWLSAFQRAGFNVGPVTPAHVAQQQQLADQFFALGIVPKKIQISDIVWQAPTR